MKFETPLDVLQNAAATAARFSEKKPNLPVLGCVLLVAEGNRLTLRATNLECGVEIVIPAKITIEGIAAVPATVFAGFLGNARGKTVSSSLVGRCVRLKPSAQMLPL